MNNGVFINRHAFIFADGAIFAVQRRGLINEVKIPVQERGDQKWEVDDFRRGLMFGRILYTFLA